jgi:hypothetical protein
MVVVVETRTHVIFNPHRAFTLSSEVPRKTISKIDIPIHSLYKQQHSLVNIGVENKERTLSAGTIHF